MALVHGNYTRDMQGGKKIRKKEQNICLLSKITKIKGKKKKNKKLQKIQASLSLQVHYMRQSAMKFQIMPLHLLRHNPKIPIKGKTVNLNSLTTS